MIHILNYGVGNIKSLSNALSYINADFKVIDSFSGETIDKLIIPGVGSYQKAMSLLREKNFIPEIQNLNSKEKIIFGICLGMQILSTTGHEGGESNGLNLIAGEVIPFPETADLIPNVGYQELIINNSSSPLLKNLPEKSPVYFTHSYHFHAKDKLDISSSSVNGNPFAASVEKNNVFGVQFHPEISQEVGLIILKNFMKI